MKANILTFTENEAIDYLNRTKRVLVEYPGHLKKR